MSCKDCPNGYYQDAAGAASCKANVCTCNDGRTAAKGTDCTTHGAEICAGCPTIIYFVHDLDHSAIPKQKPIDRSTPYR